MRSSGAMLTSSTCGIFCSRSRIWRPVVPASPSMKTLGMVEASDCLGRRKKKLRSDRSSGAAVGAAHHDTVRLLSSARPPPERRGPRATAKSPVPQPSFPRDTLMKIHEYQGKEILAQVRRAGAARLSRRSRVQEAVEAAQKLGGPVWVVKAQIHAGGRGKGGGVKVAKSHRRRQEARRRDPRHAAEDAPDRPRRPEGAPPADRGRRRHQEGILRRRP